MRILVIRMFIFSILISNIVLLLASDNKQEQIVVAALRTAKVLSPNPSELTPGHSDSDDQDMQKVPNLWQSRELSDCETTVPSLCGTKAPSDDLKNSFNSSRLRTFDSRASLGEFFDKDGNPIQGLGSPLHHSPPKRTISSKKVTGSPVKK